MARVVVTPEKTVTATVAKATVKPAIVANAFQFFFIDYYSLSY
jgi:hypothetical protein